MSTIEWSNWSGSVRLRPARIERPSDENELRTLVREARDEGRTLRAIGAGHTSSALVETSDTLVSTESFKQFHSASRESCEAVVGAGMTLKELGRTLLEHELALPNYGDVDVQTIAGVIATGTHGSGKRLQNLATLLVGARVVTGSGDIVEYSLDLHPDVLRGLRVSLGVLGVCTALRIKLVPAYRLERSEWCTSVDAAFAQLDELAETCRNVDLYWYPRSDEVKLRIADAPGRTPRRVPHARLLSTEAGWPSEVLPKARELKFDEMEYSVPAAVGVECFMKIRERVKARHRRSVAWRILYRTIAADDAYLSPAHGRDSVSISLHHNAGLPFRDYFRDVEPIFRQYGGRPHWAKKHTSSAADLRALYPQWERFLECRRALDPAGVFLGRELRDLLGIHSS